MAPDSLVRPIDVKLLPDGTRTVLRPFHVTDPTKEGDAGGRTERIIERILSLRSDRLQAELDAAVAALKSRHCDVDAMLDARFADLQGRFGGRLAADEHQARMIGIMFSEEYSIESAALFNPCVVPHFDQSQLAEGDVRLILSMRGIGEGHISSLIFQTGLWHADGSATIDARGTRATGPTTVLPKRGSGARDAQLTFSNVPIGERVIYPFLPSQGRGIEDARFCRFVDDNGTIDYRCTFTALDGTDTRQSVFRTQDFSSITGRRLDGDLAFRKGAAWFPRRIDGRFHMLGRLDEELIFVLVSDDPDTWNGGAVVIRPRFPWEFVQMGNCGSPLEIDEGWLVLTHGVGRARRYCIGAALLDRADPTRLLARTGRPLLEPGDDDGGGYVPNVVYSCGGMIRGRSLLLPYGFADNYCALGVVDLDQLVAAMT
jgi:predicted GH43/DUF377 family glycosyl hydrolase